MLRRRSRSVTGSKHSTLSDQTSTNDNGGFPPSPSDKPYNSNSLLKFLNVFFFTKPYTINPPSVLHMNLFRPEFKTRTRKAFPPPHQLPVGLALISKESGRLGNPNSVVFSSQLKTLIPHDPILPALEPAARVSEKSAMEFGMKTRKSSFLAALGGKTVEVAESCSAIEGLTVKDMELSEEYTCVIYHGPNPKTTHIFGNSVVDSCAKAEKLFNEKCRTSAIDIARGERALCSHE